MFVSLFIKFLFYFLSLSHPSLLFAFLKRNRSRLQNISSYSLHFLKVWAPYLGGGGAVRGLLACRGVLPASQQPQVYDSFLFFVVVWVSNNFRMYLCLLIGSMWCYDFFVHYEKFSSPEVSTRPEHNSFSLSLVDKKSQPTRYISSDTET